MCIHNYSHIQNTVKNEQNSAQTLNTSIINITDDSESTPPTSNSAAKRKATSVMSEDDSDYVDSSEDEHTHFFIQNSL